MESYVWHKCSLTQFVHHFTKFCRSEKKQNLASIFERSRIWVTVVSATRLKSKIKLLSIDYCSLFFPSSMRFRLLSSYFFFSLLFLSLYWTYHVYCYGRPALMDVCLHWQPATILIVVHLFNLFIWLINSLSTLRKKMPRGGPENSL